MIYDAIMPHSVTVYFDATHAPNMESRILA